MRILKMILWFGLIVVGIFSAFAVYLYFNQKNMVFYPMEELVVTPEDAGIPFADVFIEVEPDVRIHGWLFKFSQSDPRRVILFLHGNAGNISHRLETVEFLQARQVDVLMIDYRGYGKSDGEPDEANVYADARAAYDWLMSEYGYTAEDIIIFGRSLGGAVAIDLAGKVPCRGLIVESSFTSARELGEKMFPFFPIGLLLKYRFASIEKISAVHCPVLFTHSPEDDLIPYAMGRRLYEAANHPKSFVDLSGGHNDRGYFLDPSYVNAFDRLIADGAVDPTL